LRPVKVALEDAYVCIRAHPLSIVVKHRFPVRHCANLRVKEAEDGERGFNMTRHKVYIAGPEVFLPNAIEIGARKKALCEKYGFVGLFPFDNEQEPLGSRAETARSIYRGNVKMMKRADFIIANLTPFRGPSADAGTVFELGMVAGMGKLTLGYTNDLRNFGDRTRDLLDLRGSSYADKDGLTIEDFDLFDNLMIDHCLSENGYPIVRRQVTSGAERYADLDGFRECLALAQQYFHRSEKPIRMRRL
jgi:nucleoside 2-deoxyribosyltransferase